MSFDLNFLEDVDDNFKPGEMAGKMESLTDGEYDFEVNEAKFKVKAEKGMAIIEMELEVLTAGKHQGTKVQHSLFLTDKDSANRIGKDLKTLGFDCDDWTKANSRPFSKEIQKVHKVLKGLRFKGKKQKNDNNGKTYHNLYINKRLEGDGKPQRLGPEQLDAADPDDPFPG